MNLYMVLEIAKRAEALSPTPFGVLLDYWSLKTNKTKINTGNAATQTEKLARDRNIWKFVGNSVAEEYLNSFCMSSKLQGNINKSIDEIPAEPVADNILLNFLFIVGRSQLQLVLAAVIYSTVVCNYYLNGTMPITL